MPQRGARQVPAIHKQGSPGHRSTGNHIFAGGFVQKALGRDDVYVSTAQGFGTGDTEDTAEVVDMAMGENNCGDRPLRKMLKRESQGCGCGFFGGERIDHDPTLFSFDEGHVRQVEAA